MLSLAWLVFGVAVAADGVGAVRVSASGPGLAVVARSAPLSAVLEEIGRHSGIRVTYEGTAPATPLTCDFLAATAAEAFLRALEGNGLNYALFGGTQDVPGILLVSTPSGAAAPNRTAGPTRQPEPSVEVMALMDASDEESLPLVAPPPGGAIPPRFMRQGQAEPTSEGGENGSRPSGEPQIQPLETVLQTPSPPAPERARERMAGRRGANNPQN